MWNVLRFEKKTCSLEIYDDVESKYEFYAIMEKTRVTYDAIMRKQEFHRMP